VWRKLDFEKIEVEPRGEASPVQFIMKKKALPAFTLTGLKST
jgi:hypothetical protein